MISRTLRRYGAAGSRRFQSQVAAAEAPVAKPFNNKYNFNIDPPQVHHYWDQRNFSILVVFVPVFVAAGYLAQSSGNLSSLQTLVGFAEGEKSPLKELAFSEPQQRKN